MIDYRPPLRDFRFLLNDVFAAPAIWDRTPALSHASEDLASAVLEEAARIARGEMAPLNASGDQEGCTWKDGLVTAPRGFREAFAALGAGGWLSMAGNPEYGGQGLPKMLTVLVEELFYSANTSLYLYGTLTAGAAYCIDSHGTDAMRARYLPGLYDGRMAGAMALTEAHAGTDLGMLRTRAAPAGDGTYHITGTKIFLTGGEHDLTPNIIHLVLARLPDAPTGTRGLSLFLVPKHLTDENGEPGARNSIKSQSIEHKMGIKGSATSVMEYQNAVGWLLGEPHQGLAAMFTMMNYERVSIGMQGQGLAAIAAQASAGYARERLQGRAPSGPKHAGGPADPSIEHPEVRRMLLTQRAFVEGGRAFAVLVGRELDLSRFAQDNAERTRAAASVSLLTPVAKAFLTDRGFECCVMSQQVYGGAGFIVESGVEQFVRDSRIAQIYEGANGIQALDLIGRKVLRDGGEALFKLLDSFEDDLPQDAMYRDVVIGQFERLRALTGNLEARSKDDPNLPGAISCDFLELLGLIIFAWLWAMMAHRAPDDDFGLTKRHTAAWFFKRMLPKTDALALAMSADTDQLMGLPNHCF